MKVYIVRYRSVVAYIFVKPKHKRIQFPVEHILATTLLFVFCMFQSMLFCHYLNSSSVAPCVIIFLLERLVVARKSFDVGIPYELTVWFVHTKGTAMVVPLFDRESKQKVDVLECSNAG